MWVGRIGCWRWFKRLSLMHKSRGCAWWVFGFTETLTLQALPANQFLNEPPLLPRPTCRHDRPPACTMFDAPLKQVVITRFQSACTVLPSL